MNTNLNMQTMPIDRLKPAKYNPRKDLQPGDPAYEKIKRSLHDFGYCDTCFAAVQDGRIMRSANASGRF